MSWRMPFGCPWNVGGNRLKSAKFTVAPAAEAASTVTVKRLLMSGAVLVGVRRSVAWRHEDVGASGTVACAKTVPEVDVRETVAMRLLEGTVVGKR